MAKSQPTVKEICIASLAGEPMKSVDGVRAIADKGLGGDRYGEGRGSFHAEIESGGTHKRQVTLMNERFLKNSGFEFCETRRNILVAGNIELMWLIGKQFRIGQAIFEGVKYCDPCRRPDKLAGNKERNFQAAFQDCGGLVARVVQSGEIKLGNWIILPKKAY